MRVAYLGNFVPPHSTENHVAASLEALGHTVTRVQEGRVKARSVSSWTDDHDLFLWTQTYGLAVEGGPLDERRRMLDKIKDVGIPTVGFHLDRWWGLDREHQVLEEPFFRVDHLFTADGGHDDRWNELGINHYWLPPAVFHEEAVDVPASGFGEIDVLFVGAWRDYGHAEWWPYRQELLARLRERYGERFQCWPRDEAVRGPKLNRLYASARVVVGDSCLAGSPARYWSDRVPETLGRGGFLVHPEVTGLHVQHPDLPTWQLGEWDQLFALVDYYLAFPTVREGVRTVAARDVRDHHTYMDRMRELLAEVCR